jgi:O-6-methylguanine DNA methyltransferase
VSDQNRPRPLWAAAFTIGERGHSAAAASAYGIVAANWLCESEANAIDSLQGILQPLIRAGAYSPPEWIDPAGGLPPHLAAARVALAKYAAGDRQAVQALTLDTRGRAPFTAATLRCVQAIPPGKVLSYGEVAAAAGRPGAARAVGQIMGRNPLAPIVPCHRVIAAGGKPGGFGPGLPRKRELLAEEGYDLKLS